MIFKRFRQKSNEKFVKLTLSKHENKSHSKPINSLLLIFYIENEKDLKIAISLMEVLYASFKTIKCIGITDKKETFQSNNINIFHLNDFGWNGHIKNKGLSAILNEARDAVINYHKASLIELNVACLKANSDFRIGINSDNDQLYDLTILINENQINSFNNELLKYLQVLKKI